MINIEGDNVDFIADKIIKVVIKCLDEVAPKKEIKVKGNWEGKNWYTDEIHQMIKRRDETYKMARINGSEEKWIEFKKLRNEIVDKCRKAKRIHLEQKLDKNRSNPKEMWQTLKEVLKGKRIDREYKEIHCGDRIINRIEETPNAFNNYYIDGIMELIGKESEEELIENIK